MELPGSAGLGTAPLGSRPGWQIDWGRGEADAESVVGAAVSAGVGWIDTAPFYGWGLAEQVVGRALRGLADRPVLLTKCGTLPRPGGGSLEDHSAAAIQADLDASLARLGCSFVDVLQLHDPDPATPIEAAWNVICDLVAQGKVGTGGLSNHPVDLMERASASGQVGVVQHQYSLLHRAPESDGVLDWCAGHGVTFLAWSPLASGFLADGFDLADLAPTDFRRQSRFADPTTLDLRRLRGDLARLGVESGLSMSALAIGWVLSKGARAIVGARSPAEARAIPGYQPLPGDLVSAVQEAAERAWISS